MQEKKLIQAIKSDTKGILNPVVFSAYSLTPTPKYEMVQIAKSINQKLGYTLFEDCHYPRLVRDFAIVARAMAKNAVKGVN